MTRTIKTLIAAIAVVSLMGVPAASAAERTPTELGQRVPHYTPPFAQRTRTELGQRVSNYSRPVDEANVAALGGVAVVAVLVLALGIGVVVVRTQPARAA